MDYQCIVVYTVVNIGASWLAAQATRSDNCVQWFTNKIKRLASVYLHSLKFAPDCGIQHGNLACIYYREGLIDLAIDTYRRAIELQPNFPDAYCNLGNALKEKGLVSEAEECYNAALQWCPSHVDTLNNLGNVKREQGKIREATQMYMKALKYLPNFAATHNNLASLLQQQGKLHDALLHYKLAIEIHPNFADAHSNMGNALRELQDATSAMVCFQNAIAINPNLADAHCNLASIYKDMGYITEAIESYENALHLKPDFPDAYCNLAHCFQIVCNWDGYHERMHNIVRILEQQLKNEKMTSVHPHHSILYNLSNAVRKEIATRHANMYAEKNILQNALPFKHKQEHCDRIRIGYVSSDFGNHPTSHLMQSIPGLHDKTKFEVFCYALNTNDGTTFRSKIMSDSEHFIDLSNVSCNIEASNRIYKDGIQILINMNGYTKGSRNEIFALQPSPLQVMWLGYPATSGAKYMDYIITDEISCPSSSALDFSENFAFMPFTYFIGDHKQMFPHLKHKYLATCISDSCANANENAAVINSASNVNVEDILQVEQTTVVVIYGELEPIVLEERITKVPNYLVDLTVNPELVQVLVKGCPIYNGISIKSYDSKIASGEEVNDNIIFTSRRQYGLPDDAIVYCNFNQLYKFDPEVAKLWVKILKKVPNSVLWLLSFPAAGEPNLKRFVRSLGLQSDRLVFSKISCKEEHVRRGQLADVCLDTPLCNGHTTTMDVLWAGTPVVTLPGDTLASRVAASQLHALGCPELVAKNHHDYEELAVKLGSDVDYRRYIRAKVWNARLTSTLFDCEHYARGLENLYKQMVDGFQRGVQPSPIKVNYH